MRYLSSLFGAYFIFVSLYAHGAIQVTNVTGASAFNLEDDVIIYGGTAGDICSSEDIRTTCDNCATASSLKACNRSRIYNGLVLSISFQSDSVVGVAYLEDASGNKVTDLVTPPTSRGTGETHTIEVLWSRVCNAADSDSSTNECEDLSIQGNVNVGVDADADDSVDEAQISIRTFDPTVTTSTKFDTIEACTASSITAGGICDFVATPGDGKIYITSLGKSTGFPTSDGITIKALRFFIGSDESPTPGFISSPGQEQLEPADLEVTTDADGNPETGTRTIDGLENGVLHYLRVATVDLANNVTRFTSDQAITDYCDSTAVGSVRDGCIFTAKPDEVLGLLEDDLNCFVASVAYGSGLDERLNVFRKFRSDVLRPLPWGRKLVNSYYKWGPHAAAWMQLNPWAKPIVRAGLWPALGFAWGANQFGLLFTTLAFSSFGLSFMALVMTLHKRKPAVVS